MECVFYHKFRGEIGVGEIYRSPGPPGYEGWVFDRGKHAIARVIGYSPENVKAKLSGFFDWDYIGEL